MEAGNAVKSKGAAGRSKYFTQVRARYARYPPRQLSDYELAEWYRRIDEINLRRVHRTP